MMHLATGIARVTKRAVEHGVRTWTLPRWTGLVVLADIIVFLPAIIFVLYTLGTLYMALAMIEDTNPPAYEAVSLNEDDECPVDNLPKVHTGKMAARTADPPTGPAVPVTGSLRATTRLLCSVGGWRSLFRGLGVALLVSLVTDLAHISFGIFVPAPFGSLVALLALVQLSTAWLHMVMTVPQPGRRFFTRLPPMDRAFKATAAPVVLLWAATTIAGELPLFLARVMRFPVWDFQNPKIVGDASLSWKLPILFLVFLATQTLLVVPATVVLVRVQASLLPPTEDTIVPFDRSYGGTVEAVVGATGNSYLGVHDAFRTMSRASWVRLAFLFAKVWIVGMLFYGLFLAIALAELTAILITRT